METGSLPGDFGLDTVAQVGGGLGLRSRPLLLQLVQVGRNSGSSKRFALPRAWGDMEDLPSERVRSPSELGRSVTYRGLCVRGPGVCARQSKTRRARFRHDRPDNGIRRKEGDGDGSVAHPAIGRHPVRLGFCGEGVALGGAGAVRAVDHRVSGTASRRSLVLLVAA